MFGSKKEAKVVMDEYEARELKRLREEDSARRIKEQEAAAEKQRQEWASRTWVPEGNDTEVSSLKVDGGKILRIRGEYYFQRYEASYVTGLAGSAVGYFQAGQYYSSGGGYSAPVKL